MMYLKIKNTYRKYKYYRIIKIIYYIILKIIIIFLKYLIMYPLYINMIY